MRENNNYSRLNKATRRAISDFKKGRFSFIGHHLDGIVSVVKFSYICACFNFFLSKKFYNFFIEDDMLIDYFLNIDIKNIDSLADVIEKNFAFGDISECAPLSRQRESHTSVVREWILFYDECEKKNNLDYFSSEFKEVWGDQKKYFEERYGKSVSDKEFLRDYLKNAGKEWVFYQDRLKGDGVAGFSGAIHSRRIDQSLLFSVTRTMSNHYTIRTFPFKTSEEMSNYYSEIYNSLQGDGTHTEITTTTPAACVFPDAEKKYLEFANMPDQRILINMLYYIGCYPDSKTEGAPNEICKNDIMENAIRIKRNDSVKPYLRIVSENEKSPHFRRGHFRYLNSDYYKNKKGEVIFVKPSFINGKALTIKKSDYHNETEIKKVTIQ